MFVDAHIHLSDSEYDGKIGEIVAIARQIGVVAMVASSMNHETSMLSLKLAEEHQGLVYAALGIHPSNANQLTPTELEKTKDFVLESAARNGEVVAIGEIGLDPQYAKRREHKKQQAIVFNEMLKLAEQLALPIVVHSRWSAQEILGILPSYRIKGALWHWFSSPLDLLPRITERGDYVSEGPPAVFSERIREVVQHVPLERLLTETDGPVHYYGPFKDASTTPAFIPEVVKGFQRLRRSKNLELLNKHCAILQTSSASNCRSFLLL